MTLDEAIQHCKDVVTENMGKLMCFQSYEVFEAMQCRKCAEEHAQLAEWLEELKELREKAEKYKDGFASGYKEGYRNGVRDSIRPVTIKRSDGTTARVWYNEAKQMFYNSYMTVEFAEKNGWKIEEMEDYL